MKEQFSHWAGAVGHLGALLFIGAAIGIGQLLAGAERLTARLVIGRALSTGGISMGAGLALAWAPELPLVAQFGLAATLASLGAAGLERLFQSLLKRWGL